MRIVETPIPGSAVIEPELIEDERGAFARIFDAGVFESSGLDSTIVQSSVSVSRAPLTLRGLHLQRAPWSEAKLVRCTAGEIFDVIVDVRIGSPTLGTWFGITLSGANRLTVAIPRGCAHGFLTLTQDVEVFYQMADPFVPASAAGIRWDDAQLGIGWPAEPKVVSARDQALPTFADWCRAVTNAD